MNQPLNSTNTVFFSAANDSYVSKAATSLLSIRKFIPNAKLYILSKNISKKNKRLLIKNKINFIELDLTYLFFQTWDYPIECYYIFAGPKQFYNLGFKYSVYIDGDTLCLNNPLKNCEDIADFGGVEVNTFSELFNNEKQAVSDIINIDHKIFNLKRLNSGVVYMNNKKLVELHLLDKVGKLFYECWVKGIPRKGDDSLFALYQLYEHNNLSPTRLPSTYNYIPHYVGFHINTNIYFFHFSLDKPWKKHPYYHQDQQQYVYNQYVKIWRRQYRKYDILIWLKTLCICTIMSKILNRIIHMIKHIHFVLMGIRTPIIRKYINLKKTPIKLYWWHPPHINNFGDTVSKDIILNLFGRNCNYSEMQDCDMISTGSILEILQQTKRSSKLYVWGSGFIRQNSNNNNLDQAIFNAVRGNKTKSRLKLDIPMGDPGLLVNAAYSLKRRRHGDKIGVIIHYADMQTKIAKRFCEDSRFEVISPLDNPKNIARKIANCKLVLSSSLHGLIFADSLSVPNFHIKISNNLTGGIYKFQDYYSGINKEYKPANPSKIFDDNYLKHLQKIYTPVPNLIKIQKSLVKAFPFK